MAVYSIIHKSQLEGALRLDAEYYQPEYLRIAKKIKSLPHRTLEEVAERIVSFGAYSLTNFIEWQDEGIPFIVAKNIGEGHINYEDARFINEEVDEILKKSRVNEGQVLLAMSGSVGNTAIADEVPLKLNSNQDIAKITPKKNISPYFLAAFLNSNYGKKQVLRLPVGSVQQHIFLWQIKSLLVPIFSKSVEKRIEKIYKNGLQKLKNAKLLYSQTENLLLEELGLSSFAKAMEDKKDLSWIVDFSEVEKVNRIDADYFQPKYDELIAKIKKQKTKPLLDVIENVPARFNPKAGPEKTFHYVELANINSSIGVIDGSSEVLGQEAPSRARRLLKSGDVLVSSVKGSLGKVALVDKEQEGHLASTGFFQLRSKKILPEVLLVLAKSIVSQMQLEKHSAGTILTAVPKGAIEDVLAPILPKFTQQKIANLVRKSHAARKKSKELLEKAKRRIEEMIERRQ